MKQDKIVLMKKIRPWLLEFSRRLSLVAPRLYSLASSLLFIRCCCPASLCSSIQAEKGLKVNIIHFRSVEEAHWTQISIFFVEIFDFSLIISDVLHVWIFAPKSIIDHETFLSDFPTWWKEAGERTKLFKQNFRSKGFFSHYETLKWLSLWFWQPF